MEKAQLGRNKDGRLEISYDAPGEKWPDANELLRFLKKQFRARVKLRARCPATDQAVWDLQIEDRKLVMEQSDWGDITIYSENLSDEGLIERIAESILDAG